MTPPASAVFCEIRISLSPAAAEAAAGHAIETAMPTRPAKTPFRDMSLSTRAAKGLVGGERFELPTLWV